MDRRLKLGHSVYGMCDAFLFPFHFVIFFLSFPMTHMDMPRSFKEALKNKLPGQTTEDRYYF